MRPTLKARIAAQRIDEGSSGAPRAGRPDSNLLLQGLKKQPDVLLKANAATESIPPPDQTTDCSLSATSTTFSNVGGECFLSTSLPWNGTWRR